MVVKRNIIRLIAQLAGAIVVILAMTVPAVYYAIGWQSANAALRTETEIYAHQVSSLINDNPDMWTFEVVRLNGLLESRPGAEHAETRRVLDLDGNVVAQQRDVLPWPVMTRSRRLMDSGMVVGSLEIGRSLRPLLARTAILAALAAVLGTALFFLLRVYPVTALRTE